MTADQLTRNSAKGSLRATELAAKLAGQASRSDPAHVTAMEPPALDDEALERIYQRLGRRLGKREADEN